MSYTVLARKYRPQRFTDVIGQEHVTRTLRNAIEQQRIAHGYIFSGHRGIGKTTIARILAAALNCQSADQPVSEPCGICDSCVEIREGRSVDVIEIDAATNRGIEEIRELREATRYRPARDRFKVYILDEAHQITDAAFNALLKTLEEPPGHIVFLLATTQPEDIPQTIRSRCQHFSFHAIAFDQIVAQLRSLAQQEGIQADEDALAALAEAGDGSSRDALSIMDQAIACCGQRLTGELVRQLVGAVPSESLEQIMAAVKRNSSEDVLRLIDTLVTEGQSPAHLARQLVRFLRNTLVAKVAGPDSPLLQISRDERARAGRVAELFSEEDLTRFLQVLLRTYAELGYKQEQRFHLELGLLKLVHAQRLLPVEEILSGAGTLVGGSRAPTTAPISPAGAAPTRAVGRSAASPFAADLSRKNQPRSQAAVAVRSDSASLAVTDLAVAAARPTLVPAPAPTAENENELRERVLAAAEGAEYNDLAQMLRHGEWKVSGPEVLVQVPDPPALVEMATDKNSERVLSAAASQFAGRPMQVKIAGTANSALRTAAPRPAPRHRVEEEPVVRRLQEKFKAEIRSVIDYREKE